MKQNTTIYVPGALFALLLLTGCGTALMEPEEAPGSSAVEADAGQSNVMKLAATAQRDGGVRTQVIELQAVPETIQATARLTTDENRTWRVGSVTEGRIVRVQVNPGDQVERDQLLAEMHSHDIHESRAEFAKAQADLARAEGNAEFALRQRDRAARLLELKAGSITQLERAETDLKSAEIDVQNAEVEVNRTRSHLTEVLGISVDEPEEHLGEDGEDNDLIPVKSPAAGTILERNVTPGTVVNPANDLFLVSDLTRLWAIAEVNEEHLRQLRVGTPVAISVQAYPDRTFMGRIGKLGEQLDPATRTIQVRIDLSNGAGLLKPEMYADAEIQLGAGEPALMIPAEAVQDVRGQDAVFVQTSAETFEVRPVHLGRTLEGSYEVIGGLEPGETIAVEATFILKSEFLKASLSDE